MSPVNEMVTPKGGSVDGKFPAGRVPRSPRVLADPQVESEVANPAA